MIRQHGLGNGFGALIISSWAIAVAADLLPADHGPRARPPDAAVIGVATVALLRMRSPTSAKLALRVPTSGSVPLATGEQRGALAVTSSRSA